MANQFQLASDGFDGKAYSGVIRADGRWVPCAANNEDWDEYLAWLEEDPENKPDPFRSPAEGGVVLVLQEGEEAVGSMLDSLPPEPPPGAPEQIKPPATTGSGAAPSAPSTAASAARSTPAPSSPRT